jgi:hypothetical protein
MNTILMANLSAEEIAKIREAELKRRRDEREQRIVDQVARVEQEVRALRAILTKQGPGAHDAR